MAQTINIKNSSATTAPASLVVGELAYSEKAGVKKLYIGTNGGASIETVGGSNYTDQLDNAAANSIKGNNTAGVGPALDLTKAQALALLNVENGADVTDALNVAAAGAVMEGDTTTALMQFVIDEDTFASNLATKVPTQQSVKAYIASQLTAGMDYRGAYDAGTNTPDLDVAPVGVTKGDTYSVTVAGNFFATAVEVGDLIIAEINNPTAVTDWTILNKNLDAAGIKTAYESNANTNAFTDANQTNLANQSGINTGDEPAATTALAGIIEIATTAEINTGTDNTRAMSPLGFNTATIDGGVF